MTDQFDEKHADEVAAATPAEAERVGATASGLADGEWHRLHRATPLLRGGLMFFGILGIVIVNLRERLIELFIPGPGYQGDPLDYVIEEGILPIALLVVLGVLVLTMAFFYISWRMHTFRVTEELVEVRSGVVFRTHRRGRLDRIQGINVQRPFFPRIFGTAKLEVEVAGQDANVALAFLAGRAADELRADILRLASGTLEREAEAAGEPARDAEGNVLDRRVHEMLAPELDPALAAEQSVVRVGVGRLIGSTVLSSAMVFLVLVLAGAIVALVITGEPWALFGLIPFLLGFGGFLVNRVVKSLRYSIASTRDGVRIGYGLLSIRNDTLPPGRIHSISVNQELLWRPFDWWTIRVNRASRSSMQTDSGQSNTTVLPVGSREDVFRVLELLLPDLVEADLRTLTEHGLGRGRDEVFTNSPRRARVLRWFSQRRNGFALVAGAVLMRRGAIWRELVIVPMPRMQSVDVRQGPLLRRLRLAAVNVHTVAGPITASLGALDADDAQRFFSELATASVDSAQSDRTHRWGESAAKVSESPAAVASGAHAGAEGIAGEAAPAAPAPAEAPTTSAPEGRREHE